MKNFLITLALLSTAFAFANITHAAEKTDLDPRLAQNIRRVMSSRPENLFQGEAQAEIRGDQRTI